MRAAVPIPRHDNPLLPCALISTGDALGRSDAIGLGLSLLDFLIGLQTGRRRSLGRAHRLYQAEVCHL